MPDPTTTNDETAQSRIPLWTALTGFSIVVLADVASSSHDYNRTRPEKWALTVASISLSLGVLGLLGQLFIRDRFAGTPLEGGLVTLCVGIWAAGLPSMMNPENAVAVYGSSSGSGVLNTLLHANTYFFSWASFAVALVLFGYFAREAIQVQRPQNIAKRGLSWYGLCVTSFVVMAIASRTFHLTGCKDVHAFTDPSTGASFDPTGPCKRVKFGISLGVISGFIALIMGSVSHMLPLIVEALVALMMMILWCFGVGFITFGKYAPASNVGNFYFSTWISFVLALFLAADAIAETYRTVREGGDASRETPAKAPTTPTNNVPEV